MADLLTAITNLAEPRDALPLEAWHDDFGDVIWWIFPITEAPYVGSPLCSTWPGYHTHWTPIRMPQPPEEWR